MALTMGERIRALRLRAGYTQAQLAAKAGSLISEKNLGSVEQGNNQNPPLAALRALARVLGVSVGYLIDGEDPLA
jgi:transcriptional regulator with XRE-family HTH domain